MSGYCKSVADHAAGIAYSLTRVLLPNGKLEGKNWVALNPTRNDSTLGSFKIIVKGESAGLWKDFSTNDGGSNFISLILYLKKEPDSKENYIKAAKELAEITGYSDE